MAEDHGHVRFFDINETQRLMQLMYCQLQIFLTNSFFFTCHPFSNISPSRLMHIFALFDDFCTSKQHSSTKEFLKKCVCSDGDRPMKACCPEINTNLEKLVQ